LYYEYTSSAPEHFCNSHHQYLGGLAVLPNDYPGEGDQYLGGLAVLPNDYPGEGDQYLGGLAVLPDDYPGEGVQYLGGLAVLPDDYPGEGVGEAGVVGADEGPGLVDVGSQLEVLTKFNKILIMKVMKYFVDLANSSKYVRYVNYKRY
jgi:hypothetical protein